MKAQDHADLVHVGPGTLMGSFMREYWVPAAMSSELRTDAPPMRLMLLGEKLIAFRDSTGRLGVMDHRCPHRGASLFLGRVEEHGLRCIYHGWKYDVDGNCVEMPNLLSGEDYKHKIRAKAYKAVERNGLVWVYMGDRREPPPLPMIEPAHVPEGELRLQFAMRNCNWLQALDGEIDTSHVGFLHHGCLDPNDIPEGHPLENVTERAPQYLVSDAPWGTTYTSYRKARGGRQTYWRCGNYMFPFWSQTPQGEFPTNVNARAWVPLDDEHCMFVYLRWSKRPGYKLPLKNGKPIPGYKPDPDYLPNTSDWLGRWRLKADASNDWFIDREAQSAGLIFSGIDNVHLQDQAITESMGPIVDHSAEHLGPGDKMIVRTRRRILQAARDFRETGASPPGVDAPEIYLGARSGFFLADPAVPWDKAYEEQVQGAVRPGQATASV